MNLHRCPSCPSQPPIQRPPMQELIETGIEPEPDADDMFIKETPRPPKFKTQIQPQTRLMESQPAHFECKLTPIGDPNMKVEWYKDGELLRAGTETEGFPRSSESTILELILVHVNFVVIISGLGAVYCFRYLAQRYNNGQVTYVV